MHSAPGASETGRRPKPAAPWQVQTVIGCARAHSQGAKRSASWQCAFGTPNSHGNTNQSRCRT
eukprot:3413067-Karenia_brevis.AAC.1